MKRFIKYLVSKIMLSKIGSRIFLKNDLSLVGLLKVGARVEFGSNNFVNRNYHISLISNSKIGSNNMWGPNCVVFDHNHLIPSGKKSLYDSRKERVEKPVHIGNDNWFGAGVIILPGVRIGDGNVVGAGSVVTRDVGNFSICVGNPAQVIASR